MKYLRVVLAILTLSLSASASAELKTSLRGDESLKPGDKLISPDGFSYLEMKDDGSIRMMGGREYPGYEYWNPGVFGQELLFQWDGNLVLYKDGRVPVWSIGKGTVKDQVTKLIMTKEGSLQAYGENGQLLWRTNDDPRYTPANPPGRTCPGGVTPLLYPACANAGTSFQYTIPIPACSPAEAAQLARASGFTPGTCR